MFRLLRLLRTSIGRKAVMALSGLVLVLFIAGHMAGNLSIFQGPDALNGYAAWLQGHPLLWGVRLLMLAILLVHILIALRLAVGNRRARSTRYRGRGWLTARLTTGVAARTMLLSGLLLFAFLVYHLLHLTLGLVQPQTAGLLDAAGRPDVYARVVGGFENPWIALVYAGAVLLVGLHLQHAVASLVRTLGFSHDGYHQAIDVAAGLVALLVVAGFLAIPLAVQTGLLGMGPATGPAAAGALG